MPKASGKSFKFESEKSIRNDFLETIKYEGGRQKVTLGYPEFNAVCPFSGLPDIGTLTIEYIPKRTVVELKSLKYYLVSFRNVGIYQEKATDRIHSDLKKLLKPEAIKITLLYNTRGGIEAMCEAGEI